MFVWRGGRRHLSFWESRNDGVGVEIHTFSTYYEELYERVRGILWSCN